MVGAVGGRVGVGAGYVLAATSQTDAAILSFFQLLSLPRLVLVPSAVVPCCRQVTTEEERVKFTEQLSEGEDWLYGDGETADATAFTAKLKGLQVVGKPITLRASEAELRPEVSLKDMRGLRLQIPYPSRHTKCHLALGSTCRLNNLVHFTNFHTAGHTSIMCADKQARCCHWLLPFVQILAGVTEPLRTSHWTLTVCQHADHVLNVPALLRCRSDPCWCEGAPGGSREDHCQLG